MQLCSWSCSCSEVERRVVEGSVVGRSVVSCSVV